MPELPEVEAARQLVQKWCVGQTVLEAKVADDANVIDGVGFKELQSALGGRTFNEACRKGKQLWINFDRGPSLLLHLGMTGHIAVKGQESLKYMLARAVDINEWPPKYCKVELTLSSGICMAFCDSRRFAKVKFLEGPSMEDSLPAGWDALKDEPTAEQLASRVGKRRTAVKSILLDQTIYAGIGNWCADEILHDARIHPEELVCNLTAQQLDALRSSIRHIMTVAVSCGADSSLYPIDWLFHSRWAPKKAPAHVSFVKIGGRTTALDGRRQLLNKTVQDPEGSTVHTHTSPTESEAESEPSCKISAQKTRIAPAKKRRLSARNKINDRLTPAETSTMMTEHKRKNALR